MKAKAVFAHARERRRAKAPDDNNFVLTFKIIIYAWYTVRSNVRT